MFACCCALSVRAPSKLGAYLGTAMAMNTYKLLRQRHLLKLHPVYARRGGAQQRARREEGGRLHDDDEIQEALE